MNAGAFGRSLWFIVLHMNKKWTFVDDSIEQKVGKKWTKNDTRVNARDVDFVSINKLDLSSFHCQGNFFASPKSEQEIDSMIL